MVSIFWLDARVVRICCLCSTPCFWAGGHITGSSNIKLLALSLASYQYSGKIVGNLVGGQS